jgi:hypothetical protein
MLILGVAAASEFLKQFEADPDATFEIDALEIAPVVHIRLGGMVVSRDHEIRASNGHGGADKSDGKSYMLSVQISIAYPKPRRPAPCGVSLLA